MGLKGYIGNYICIQIYMSLVRLFLKQFLENNFLKQFLKMVFMNKILSKNSNMKPFSHIIFHEGIVYSAKFPQYSPFFQLLLRT